jgi:hypothetical protein
MNTKPAAFLLGCAIFFGIQSSQAQPIHDEPRIVNIVNFIRLLEPRDSTVTEDVLYQTVVRQVEMMRANRLGGTFLLQYDALMDERYQRLLRSLPKDSFDIGAWWEIPQPLVVKAGLPWRGQYPWDWHANIGFSTGYTPEERKKLADVYMADFKKIFGYYPKSAGCWFIDEVTLDYLYHKYGIVASCNCKDQAGTDGYTLWGGYWNQAYYPSKVNAYMPAQDEADAIQVPIFRMLGSDPIRQYDMGVGAQRQGVETLEPVYKAGGGDSAWVNWFFKELVEGESLAFGYTQAGQENSFTWDAMAKGFGIQLPLIAQLRAQKKIRVETLAESGRWFREHYRVTPATAVTVNGDLAGGDRRTVWYDSRFYRANIFWEGTRGERTFEGTADTRSDSSVGGSNGVVAMRFRDIHIFNEHFPSPYLSKPVTSNDCAFFTLPVVDGYRWSTSKRTREGAADIRSGSSVGGMDVISGLRLKTMVGGKETDVTGGKPVIGRSATGALHIEWPLTNVKGTLVMDLDEKSIRMKIVGGASWFLDLTAAAGMDLPFQRIAARTVQCRFGDMDYSIKAARGVFSKPDDAGDDLIAWRLTPEGDELILELAH